MGVALGHRKGVEALREIVRFCSDEGIEVLSLYAFSTENWSRPQAEVSALMRMVEDFFVSEIDELDEKQVRIRVLGELEALPDGARKAASDAIERTRGNAGLQLNIALNYGARDEILRAAGLMAQEAAAGFLNAREAAREDFERHLYTSLQPDVDLLIRPGGERRLSNFLLYQCAYAELVFMEKLWPDFTADDFREALKAFESRERRFGGREA